MLRSALVGEKGGGELPSPQQAQEIGVLYMMMPEVLKSQMLWWTENLSGWQKVQKQGLRLGHGYGSWQPQVVAGRLVQEAASVLA